MVQLKNKITIQTIKTDIFHCGDSLFSFLLKHLRGQVNSGDVVAVTSKIISVAEGRFVEYSSTAKRQLVEREADVYLGEGGYGIELTVKHGILIPSAGIDESNSQSGDYILFPEDPYKSAAQIGEHLRREFGIRELGVILTDSHTTPLRRGVTGISLAHYGIKATESLVGRPDVFGRTLKYTSVDVVDSLAAMAVFAMGEAEDCSPLAVISGAKLEFTNSTSKDEIAISLEEDLYYPLLKTALRKLSVLK